ncbi:MAG: DUF3040 domain-containing protein [Actinomycetaceae bacterium]|nr:DUF3040 domain-containing protein [Actinomycetaceae bacterium]
MWRKLRFKTQALATATGVKIMALSEQERQILEQMERELRKEDPDLASTMSTQVQRPQRVGRKSYSPRRVATGIVIAVIGLILPLVGITIGITWLAVVLGALGFGLMLAGVLMIAIPTLPGDKVAPAKMRDTSSFMERQQRKWDERRRQ